MATEGAGGAARSEVTDWFSRDLCLLKNSGDLATPPECGFESREEGVAAWEPADSCHL